MVLRSNDSGSSSSAASGPTDSTRFVVVRCQTEAPVDDVLVETNHSGFVFVQAKSGLRLDRGTHSPLRSATDQFVRQWRACAEGSDGAKWARPVDRAKDRLVLATTSSSERVNAVLPRLLQRLRDDEAADGLRSVSRSTDEIAVAQVIEEVTQECWRRIYGRAAAAGEIASLLRNVRVQVLDLEDNGRDTASSLELLRSGVLQNPDDASKAWVAIQALTSQLHSTRSGVNASPVLSFLGSIDIGIRTAPDFRQDVENLGRVSQRMVERSVDFSLLVRGRTETAITRHYAEPLRDAVLGGSVLLVGEPGAGKSGVLYQLARILIDEGKDVVFLSVDTLSPVRSSSDLRNELQITHDLQDVLGNWQGSESGYLILDALDAARNFDTQIVLKAAIADLQNQQTRWHIIASIREYDLRHGTEWQRLFAGPVGTAGGRREFRGVRHIYVQRLEDSELDELSRRYPPLRNVLSAGSLRLRALLTNIFNLHLMAELLERGVDPNRLGTVSTQIQLLDEYWLHRVVRNNDLHDQRELAVRRIAERMIADRATRVFRADIQGLVQGNALPELERENIIRSSDPNGDLLIFAHHILFDYAISRLIFLRGRSPDRLVGHLRAEPDLVLMLGPSLSLCFQDLWFLDDHEQFWPLSFGVAAAADLPEIAKLSAPVVAAEAARTIDDFRTLFDSLVPGHRDQVSAENFVGHLIGALLVISEGSAGALGAPWPAFAEKLTEFARRGVLYSMRTLVWKLSAAFDTLQPQDQSCLGKAARALLERAWSQTPRDGYLVVAAIEAVTKTFGSDPEAATVLLRRALEPEQMRKFAYQELPWLARGVSTIMETAPEFATDIYTAAFGYHEASDAGTSIGESQILGLKSNRAQDYRMAWYSLEQEFPRFLRVAPLLATRALLNSLVAHVERSHSYSSNRAEVKYFEFGDRIARVRVDYSSIWNSRGRMSYNDVGKLLAHFAQYLSEVASDPEGGRKFASILEVVIAENELAAIWSRLLAAGAAAPEVFARYLEPLAYSGAILSGLDTTFDAGQFVKAAYKVFDPATRARIESAILNLDSDHRRSILIGCIPRELVETQEARDARQRIAEKNEIPRNRPPFEVSGGVPYTSEMMLRDQGVELDAPENQAIREAEKPVDSFKAYPNETPPLSTIDEALTGFRQLLDLLRSSAGAAADDRVTEHAWSVLSEAAAQAARNRDAVQTEATRLLLTDILISASARKTPDPSPEHNAQFDHSPSWGGPSARVGSAEGLMSVGFYFPQALDEVLPVIEKLLTADPAPEVRYQVSSRLHLFLDVRPGWVWAQARRLVDQEQNRGVIIGLLSQPMVYLASRNVDGCIDLVLRLRERFSSDASDGAQQCNELTLTILADLYFHRNNPRARAAVYGLFEDPAVNGRAIKLVISRHRDSLTAGDDANASDQGHQLRERALAFYAHALNVSWKAQASIRSAHEGQPPDAWPEHARDGLGEYFRILSDITMELYFASGASGHRPGNVELQPPNAVQIRFYREASPLLRRLSEAPISAIAHYLIDTLGFFADIDPKAIFHLIANAVRAAATTGYAVESLGVQLVVKVVERYLADYRDVFADADARQDLMDCLDAFLRVGWPEARALTYRIADIWR